MARRFRNRTFLILMAVWTAPAAALVVLFAVIMDQHGHPPVAILAAPVLLIWFAGIFFLLVSWWIVLMGRD